MTIMHAGVLYPPLEDDDNDIHNTNSSTATRGNMTSLMSPDLEERFERLKRLRETDDHQQDAVSRRKLATEAALLAHAEITRMRQAVAELEGLLGEDSDHVDLIVEGEQDDSNFPKLPQVVVVDSTHRGSPCAPSDDTLIHT
jgi:hypothetical protein